MTDISFPSQVPQWIQDHVRQYLADGEAGHMWDSTPRGGPGPLATLLLTTTGRRSGQQRILPLLYGETPEGYVIIASKGGAPAHPSWYLNLVDRPDVTVQIANRRFRAKARTASGDERSVLWDQMVEIYPPYADYQTKTDRKIPVVVLTPTKD